MLLQKRHGQSGVELIALTAFLLFIFSGVYVAFLKNDIDMANSEIHLKANELGKLVAFEVSSAVQVGDGYRRNFTLPQTINGALYGVSLDESFIVVNTSLNSFYVATIADEVVGSFVKGKNSIRNENGVIYVNT